VERQLLEDKIMNRCTHIALTTMALLWAAAVPPTFNAAAQQKSLKEQIIGAWTLTSIYDDFAGIKKDTWGPNVHGIVIFDHSGQFGVHIISANRPQPVGNSFPSNPVGQALGYFGRYSIDEPNQTVTFHIDRSTFPGWDGIDQKRVVSMKGDEMSYKGAAPIPSSDGPFVPYSQWKRAK
jgi:hypothetical protein